MIYRPIILDEEIKFSKKKFVVSKTDVEGNILFVNQNFCDITGYRQQELIGEPHNVLRHPDMPKAIFYMIWKSLLAGMEVSAIVKNVAKSGKYYWVIADFSMQRDNYGKLETFTSFKRTAPKHVSENMTLLYHGMLSAERKGGLEASLRFLEMFLEEKQMSYNEYLEDLVEEKGFFSSWVNRFKSKD
ncbi:MAG: SIGNAL-TRANSDUCTION SENSOR PROTEIN-PAS/PAC domain [uncultured Sulfurovum sp.]|uniref:SIGNAL-TRANSDUCTION SENSOR PROTEIN-PAS/PAC domain n=1 Tax=uncultured Sulfurovum sp. TaxID=269237 RepID=A0A6S6SIM9_9BACT|nr:MAG: SIGNAL-TRANSDUCTION SENSOR PROTEIN-PAS/PAC domain [uncultured Sulfurovum sp.]